MLSRKAHIEQINRFHDKMEEISEKIKENKDDETKKDYIGRLSFTYFKLSEIWVDIDNVIEFKIKHEIDCLENSPQSNKT